MPADDAFLRWKKNQPAQPKPVAQPVQRAPFNNPFINTLPQWNGGKPVNYQTQQTPAPYNNPYIRTLPQWNGGQTVNYSQQPTFAPMQAPKQNTPKLSILNSPIVNNVQSAEAKNALYNKLYPQTPDLSRFFYNAGLL